MSKKNVMISIDEYIHKRAQEKHFNVSDICEHALKIKSEGTIKDVPENALKLRCMQCHKEIEYGFLCEDRQIFLCQECQDAFNMMLCKHDQDGQHEHVRIPGINMQRTEMINNIKQVTNNDGRN